MTDAAKSQFKRWELWSDGKRFAEMKPDVEGRFWLREDVAPVLAQQAERIAELEAELKSFRNERAMREAWAADALKKPIESYE